MESNYEVTNALCWLKVVYTVCYTVPESRCSDVCYKDNMLSQKSYRSYLKTECVLK